MKRAAEHPTFVGPAGRFADADADARERFDAGGTLELPRAPASVAPLEQLIARETDANTKQYAEQVLGRLRKKE